MKKVLVGLSLMSQLAQAQPRDTFVLVHGALFTSDGWVRVEHALRNQGHSVVSFDVPGRREDGLQHKDVDLDLAVAKLTKVVEAQQGSVILVGHSQGGALITQAVSTVGHKIKGLVYISAVVPASGETAFDKLSEKTHANFGATVTSDPDKMVFSLRKDRKALENGFFQDLREVSEDLAELALNGMVSEPMRIGLSPLKYSHEKLQSLPKFYVETTLDQIVDIENQREYQRSFAFEKVYSIDSGHSPFLSRPEEVTAALQDVYLQLRPLADEESKEKKVVETFYRAFAKGDYPTVVGLIAEDIKWRQPGQSALSGVYDGKESVLKLFGQFGSLSDGTLKLIPRHIMQNGQDVAVLLDFSAQRKERSISSMGIDIFKVKNGQIIEATLFTDFQTSEDKFWSE